MTGRHGAEVEDREVEDLVPTFVDGERVEEVFHIPQVCGFGDVELHFLQIGWDEFFVDTWTGIGDVGEEGDELLLGATTNDNRFAILLSEVDKVGESGTQSSAVVGEMMIFGRSFMMRS
jgi:hypothetical protein